MKIRTLLMVLCSVVGVTLLSGCSKSPEKVVEAWHKAVMSGDKTAIKTLTTGQGIEATKIKIGEIKEWRKTVKKDDGDASADKLDDFEKFKVGKADIDENKAEVVVTYGKETEKKFTLKKTRSGWKVQSFEN